MVAANVATAQPRCALIRLRRAARTTRGCLGVTGVVLGSVVLRCVAARIVGRAYAEKVQSVDVCVSLLARDHMIPCVAGHASSGLVVGAVCARGALAVSCDIACVFRLRHRAAATTKARRVVVAVRTAAALLACHGGPRCGCRTRALLCLTIPTAVASHA